MPSRRGKPPPEPPSTSTLEQVLAALGPAVLRVLAAPAGVGLPVTRVVIYDPLDPPTVPAGAVVLGVGLAAGTELSRVMEHLAQDGAILVVKARGDEAQLAAEADRAGVTLLSAAHGAAWMQVASLVRSAMNDDAVAREGEALGGVAAGDLFAVANAVSALIDAPVTIEDPQSRVIAYSSRQDEADNARMITILGRQVPDEFYVRFQREGVFRRLYRERAPMYLDGLGKGVLPRLAVAVKAGDELLGSIWAAVKEKPSQEKLDDFAEAANFVAIHLLRHRLASDVQRGLQSELMSVVLGGGALAQDAASRLGLAGEAFRVVAVGLRAGDAIDNEVLLLRCWDTLSLHLSVASRRAATALVEGVVYAVVPVPADRVASRRLARQAADGFLTRLQSSLRESVLVGIGGLAGSVVEIPKARLEADRVLLVMKGAADARRSIGEIEDLRLQVLLFRLGELADDAGALGEGPLGALAAHDSAHNTRFVETLRAYLDAFGDIAAAADALGIHHNTLRYRMNKLQQVPGVDLNDPEQRLALQLQLRMLAPDTAH